MIEIDKDVWISAPESVSLEKSSRNTIDGSEREELIQQLRHAEKSLRENPNDEHFKKYVETIREKVNARKWYARFIMPSRDQLDSAFFDSREEALTWLGEIGLNLRPFPFKEKKEEG